MLTKRQTVRRLAIAVFIMSSICLPSNLNPHIYLAIGFLIGAASWGIEDLIGA